MASKKVERLLEIEAELADLSQQISKAQPTQLSAINSRMGELVAERESLQREPGGDDEMIPTRD